MRLGVTSIAIRMSISAIAVVTDVSTTLPATMEDAVLITGEVDCAAWIVVPWCIAVAVITLAMVIVVVDTAWAADAVWVAAV
jgi:hypothetical protein